MKLQWRLLKASLRVCLSKCKVQSAKCKVEGGLCPHLISLHRKENIMDCIFCKIVNGDIPSNKVYEDDKVLAFYDLEPQAPVHVLIIPKQHIASAAEINAENSSVVAHIFEVAAIIAKEKGLDNGYRIVNNCGESAGQTVKHLHFHLMGGRDFGWPAG